MLEIIIEKKIILSLKKSKLWKNQMKFIEFNQSTKPSWFGLPIIINDNYVNQKKKYINYLESNGIETRPIISGNFTNQPSVKLFNLNPNKIKFPNADEIEKKGFFIGLHTTKIKKTELDYLSSKLLKLGNF